MVEISEQLVRDIVKELRGSPSAESNRLIQDLTEAFYTEQARQASALLEQPRTASAPIPTRAINIDSSAC